MKWISILVVLLISASCHTPAKKEGMTREALSVILCNCASPVVDFNRELQSLAEAQEMGALSQKMTEGDQIMQTAISCVIDKIDESTKSIVDDTLTKRIDEQCQLDKRMTADLFEKIQNYEFPTY